jgi:phosphomannomutase/phosphoglucomutase
MLGRNQSSSLGDLYDALPRTYGSPTMSPHCPDEEKYCVVERIEAKLRARMGSGEHMAGLRIVDLVTVNGVRVMVEDGTWGLVRASSNKPELVIVVESPISEVKRNAMFRDLDALIRENPEVGAYNQTLAM